MRKKVFPGNILVPQGSSFSISLYTGTLEFFFTWVIFHQLELAKREDERRKEISRKRRKGIERERREKGIGWLIGR